MYIFTIFTTYSFSHKSTTCSRRFFGLNNDLLKKHFFFFIYITYKLCHVPDLKTLKSLDYIFFSIFEHDSPLRVFKTLGTSSSMSNPMWFFWIFLTYTNFLSGCTSIVFKHHSVKNNNMESNDRVNARCSADEGKPGTNRFFIFSDANGSGRSKQVEFRNAHKRVTPTPGPSPSRR